MMLQESIIGIKKSGPISYLDFKIGNFAFDVTEIIWAKKISVKL